MRHNAPRRAFPWACAACLGGLAAVLFWPMGGPAELRGTAAQVPEGGGPRAAEAPEPAAGDEAWLPGPEQAEAAAETLAAAAERDEAGAEAQAWRDAVADAPRLKSLVMAQRLEAAARAFWPAPAAQDHALKAERPGRSAGPPGQAPAARPGPRLAPKLAQARSAGARAAGLLRLKPESVARGGRAFAQSLAQLKASRARALAPRPAGRTAGPQRRGTAGARSAGSRGRAPEPKAKAPAPARKSLTHAPRFRPVLLPKLLGKGAIRPPKAGLAVPDVRRWAGRMPQAGPDGKPRTWSFAKPSAIEAAKPLSRKQAACRASRGHWHAGKDSRYHERQAWGSGGQDGWLWLRSAQGRWWAWTEPGQPVWLWSGGHWWWQSDGVWFLLHEGQAWGYRLFGERKAEGLVHPQTGTQLIYSADGSRVEMITPGDGAWLFDAKTGEVLARLSEEQLPAKPKPRAPQALSLP